MKDSCNYVTNINRVLKSIKSEVTVEFIRSDKSGVIIVTNKVASPLDLQTIESYIKSAKHIEAKGVEVSWLPQSKSYLKIIGIPYIRENANTPITSEVVEEIIKESYLQQYCASIKILNNQDLPQVQYGYHMDWYLKHPKW